MNLVIQERGDSELPPLSLKLIPSFISVKRICSAFLFRLFEKKVQLLLFFNFIL